MMKQLHITTVCLFGALFMNAQAVYFVQGTEVFPENFKTEKLTRPAENEIFEGKYIRYVQFYQLPNSSQQQILKEKNLLLLDYVPDRVYQVAVPANFDWNTLTDFGIRSIVQAKPEWRMHKNLMERPFGNWALHGDKIGVSVQVQPFISIDTARILFKKRGIKVHETGTQNGYLLIHVKPEILPQLAALPWINWLELESPPGEPEDLKGRALLRAGALDSDHPAGKKYNGAGVSLLIRDDGFIGPHIDLQARMTNDPGISADPSKTHGDRVAGTLAGAGNLDPAMRGIVPGAHLFASDFTAGFQDGTLPLLFSDHVTITNSSYSNGCNDGYTLAAQTVDKQLFENKNYMHVFSAGNSNGIDCQYGAGGDWGNITGGNKLAKNALVVGNIDINGVIANNSSRGPATDGRLKPDLMGFGGEQYATGPNNTYQGFSGTSAASPGVAGCFAQLTHAWKTIHNTADAPAALLKAVMLNTATDLGHPGPDFKYGWGQANNWRALKAIEESRFDSGYVLSDVTYTFEVNVPAGVRQANFMIYWADPPGTLNAQRALVNDLDLNVNGPGSAFLPWKLNPTPDPALLDAPAGKGHDSLNNMEQVSVTNPVAGSYLLFVSSLDIPTDSQDFFLTWDFLYDSIQITQPAAGESLAVGTFEWITWDAYGNEGEFTLEYSTNGGANYSPIATVQGNVRFYGWIVPQAVSGNVKIRISRNGQVAVTELPITIAPQPINFVIDKVCPQSVTLKWFNSDNTLPIEIFKLGEKYMESAGTAPAGSTSFTVPVQDASTSQWFSARYANNAGLTGRRVVAVNSQGGLINCQQTNDLATTGIVSPDGSDIFSCGPLSVPVTVSVANHGTASIGNATISYQNNNNPAVVENLPFLPAGGAFDFTFSTPLVLDANAINNLVVTVLLNNEQYQSDNSISTSFAVTAGIADADYLEGFEKTPQIPSTWKITNPDGAFTWAAVLNPVIGIDGNPTNAVYVNHFSYNPGTGQEDILALPPTAIQSTDTLQFDYSHAIYSAAYVEKLRVEIVEACNAGGTPVVLWEKSDPSLALDQTDVAFFPDAPEDWARVEIPLASFAGQNAVIRFITTNDYGNNTFLDNIGFKNLPPMLGETLAIPDTFCLGTPISISANPNPAQTIDYQWSFGLGAQPSTATGPGPISVLFNTPGDIAIQLIGNNAIGSDTLTKTVFTKPSPVADFDFQINGLTVLLTNNSVNAGTWLWDFGDGTSSTTYAPSHTYATHGSYTITLTATGECGIVSYAQNVTTSQTIEQIGLSDFKVSPNPGNGLFNATVSSPVQQGINIALLDNSGRLIHQQVFDIQQGTSFLSFDCSGVAAGNYSLRVETQLGRFSVGVVIVR